MPLKTQGDKEELRLQLQAARSSTASMGKFDSKLKNDKEAHKTGKKRKVNVVLTMVLWSYITWFRNSTGLMPL